VKIFGLFTKTVTPDSRQSKNTPADEARETSQKIDSIESEIVAEFGAPTLLQPHHDSHVEVTPILAPLSHVLDEAAVLFANGQSNEAKTLLLQATRIDGSSKDHQLAWWMLFDLALAGNHADFFDHLALSYAKKFETSPPQWQSTTQNADLISAQPELPVLSFRGKLTEDSLAALEQLQHIGLRHHHFVMEFAAITDLTIAGCAAFLSVLEHWQKASCEISIRGGDAVVSRIQECIQSGRRDSDDAAWRLLIELLRLMNADEAYEAACVDYSVTYEMSPPASLQVQTKPVQQTPVFVLPTLISLPIDKLIAQTSEYAKQSPKLLFDCRHLRRIDFSATTPWLTGLQQLAQGKVVECRDTSFLVGRLLQLVGGASRLHIIYRKP
jgi:ABC-type transporter Mla MlaB component